MKFPSSVLAPVAVAFVGCSDGAPALTADAAPQRGEVPPCGTRSESTRDAVLRSGRYHVEWTPPCRLGSINPLAASEIVAIDTAAATATFLDEDGGCAACGAVQHGTMRGACLDLEGATVGATKVLAPYALCATTAGIEAVQIWSGYPGPPEPEGWLLRGAAE